VTFLEETKHDAGDYDARYARHFSLPGIGRDGQQKLQSARVLIVGVGGLGSPIALYLAAAGVGHIALIDDDKISLANLQRQILYSTSQVSQSKVDVAQKRLLELNPELQIEAIHDRITAKNAEQLVGRYDLIVDGSDNFSSRYVVNEACVRAKKPLVFGAIYRFDGQVSVFGLANSPCYRCLYPEAPQAEAVPGCSEAGVLGVLPGVVGTLMATEVLKIILGIGKSLSGQVLIYDALGADFRRMKISRRQDCQTCGDHAYAKLSVEITDSTPATTIGAEELKNLLMGTKPPILIDVRSEDEFLSRHLPGSLNIPLAQLSKNLDRIPQGSQVIVVCQSGKRSARAVEILRASDRQDIHHLDGGLETYGL
jgi:sulfur-carrier protein adenylyltransferase/sulfurtransferase